MSCVNGVSCWPVFSVCKLVLVPCSTSLKSHLWSELYFDSFLSSKLFSHLLAVWSYPSMKRDSFCSTQPLYGWVAIVGLSCDSKTACINITPMTSSQFLSICFGCSYVSSEEAVKTEFPKLLSDLGRRRRESTTLHWKQELNCFLVTPRCISNPFYTKKGRRRTKSHGKTGNRFKSGTAKWMMCTDGGGSQANEESEQIPQNCTNWSWDIHIP